MQEEVEKCVLNIQEVVLRATDRQVARELKKQVLHFMITLAQAEEANEIISKQIHYTHALETLIAIKVCLDMLNFTIANMEKVKQGLKYSIISCQKVETFI